MKETPLIAQIKSAKKYLIIRIENIKQANTGLLLGSGMARNFRKTLSHKVYINAVFISQLYPLLVYSPST